MRKICSVLMFRITLTVLPMHCFLLQGDTIASCDSYGIVKLWDVRTVSPMTVVDCGPHAANMVSFDPSGISSLL